MRRQEDQIQKAIVEHFRCRGAPNTVMFSVPNGGARTRTEAAILKATGVLAGAPDLVFVKAGRIYGLEVKTKNGRLSHAQLVVQGAINDAGGYCATAFGLDKAIAILETWGLLTGRVQ
jgi:hypothetical protein